MVSTDLLLGGQSFPDIMSQVSLVQQLIDGQCRCRMNRVARLEDRHSATTNI